MFRKSIIKPLLKSLGYVRKISGKTKEPSYTYFNIVGTDNKVTSKIDISDTSGETFCYNSSSFKYSESFIKINKRTYKS